MESIYTEIDYIRLLTVQLEQPVQLSDTCPINLINFYIDTVMQGILGILDIQATNQKM